MFPIRDVNPTQIKPLVTWAVIALNAAVFALVQPRESPQADEFAYRNAAIACELTTGDPLDWAEVGGPCIEQPLGDQPFPGKSVWLAVLWSMFLHGGLVHLLGNMWSLWIFGNNVEEAFGHILYAGFYLAAGIVATIGFALAQPDATVPLVGASGAIAGVMGAYVVLFPRHQVLTLVFLRVVAIPALAFLGIWFLLQFLMAGEATGIAWEAHVAGFGFGVLVTLPIRERLRSRIGAPAYRA